VKKVAAFSYLISNYYKIFKIKFLIRNLYLFNPSVNWGFKKLFCLFYGAFILLNSLD